MNIYQHQPPICRTSRQLSGYLTSIHLVPRELTESERIQYGIKDMVDEEMNIVRTEAWTAIDTYYRHAEPLTEEDYPHLVSAIIRSKYSADAVEAIQLNYINDREGGKSEMDALQDWRTVAKDAARKAIAQS